MEITYLENHKTKWRDWLMARAHGTHAKIWLALIAFTESFIFPIPTVAFLIPILMAGSKRWVFYALFTTGFSVLGGVVGYVIGAFFFDTIGQKIVVFYNLTSEVAQVQELFDRNAFFVMFTGAFTPLPYKVFTLSAGFLKIGILPLIVASILGRGLQFFVVAYIFKLYGAKIAEIFFRYFSIAVFILTAIVLVAFFIKIF